jgi:hypothetical protein
MSKKAGGNWEPPVSLASELLDVRDHELALDSVTDVRRRPGSALTGRADTLPTERDLEDAVPKLPAG